MNHAYWDLSWTISFDAPGIKEALELLSHSHPVLGHLVRTLGQHFHRSLIHALVTLFCSSQRYPLGSPLSTYQGGPGQSGRS